MANIPKRSKGYGYTYADLATIHEELERQGIKYYQFMQWDEQAQGDYVFTVLDYGEGEKSPRRGCRVITEAGAKMSAAQAQGSGITYARRYSLLMALGWATEDDDGASVAPAKVVTPGQKFIDIAGLKEELAQINDIEQLRAKYAWAQKTQGISDYRREQILQIIKERSVELDDGQNVD